jgi:hypothetical protein
MYSKLWDLKNSIVKQLLLCGNRPCVEFLVGRLGLSIWWRVIRRSRRGAKHAHLGYELGAAGVLKQTPSGEQC